jgi:NADH:ubiquinone oxidoreductase subunit E
MKTIPVQICFGTHCTMMGAMDILEAVTELKERMTDCLIEIEIVKCFGDCNSDRFAPVVVVSGERFNSATTEQVMARIMSEAIRA